MRGDGTALLCDFGHLRHVPSGHYKTRMKTDQPFTPLQNSDSGDEYGLYTSRASDVHQFGFALLELCNGQEIDSLAEGLDVKLDDRLHDFKAFLIRCIDPSEQSRPSARDCVETLGKMCVEHGADEAQCVEVMLSPSFSCLEP